MPLSKISSHVNGTVDSVDPHRVLGSDPGSYYSFRLARRMYKYEHYGDTMGSAVTNTAGPQQDQHAHARQSNNDWIFLICVDGEND